MPMTSPLRWSQVLLGTALVLKGLTWPPMPWTVELALVAAGTLAILRVRTDAALLAGGAVLWIVVLGDHYWANHVYLLAVMTTLCGVASAGPVAASIGKPLMAIQVSAVYLWAGLWKLNATFLTGTVVLFEWRNSHLVGGFDLPEGLAIAAGVSAVAAELVIAGLLWVRRAVLVAIVMGACLHLGMVVSIGGGWVQTAELVVFALACGSAYPVFAERAGLVSSAEPSPRTFV
jgi:hypothetical protein